MYFPTASWVGICTMLQLKGSQCHIIQQMLLYNIIWKSQFSRDFCYYFGGTLPTCRPAPPSHLPQSSRVRITELVCPECFWEQCACSLFIDLFVKVLDSVKRDLLRSRIYRPGLSPPGLAGSASPFCTCLQGVCRRPRRSPCPPFTLLLYVFPLLTPG